MLCLAWRCTLALPYSCVCACACACVCVCVCACLWVGGREGGTLLAAGLVGPLSPLLVKPPVPLYMSSTVKSQPGSRWECGTMWTWHDAQHRLMAAAVDCLCPQPGRMRNGPSRHKHSDTVVLTAD